MSFLHLTWSLRIFTDSEVPVLVNNYKIITHFEADVNNCFVILESLLELITFTGTNIYYLQ